MKTNVLPAYDYEDNPTGCCAHFHPEGWDNQTLHLDNKKFVRATTHSLFHIPLDMGKVFQKTFDAIESNHARKPNEFLVMSDDLSAWKAEHLFAVDEDVPGADMVTLTGTFMTKVFEGPYKDIPKWMTQLTEFVEEKGKNALKTYFFFTTCPKCAKYYGQNYVVGIAEVQ